MKYSLFKSALSKLFGDENWPETPKSNNYFYIIDPKKVATHINHFQIKELEVALSTWLPENPFTNLFKNLPKELQELTDTLQKDLTVSEFGITTGETNTNNENFIKAFNFSFQTPTIEGVKGLPKVRFTLGLNQMQILGNTIWNPIIKANLDFLGITCDLNMGLFAPSVRLSLVEQQPSLSINSLLKKLDKNYAIEIENLFNTIDSKFLATNPKIVSFNVLAELSDPLQFSCFAGFETPISWKGISFSKTSLAFSHGGENNIPPTLQAEITLGGFDISGVLQLNKNKVHFQGAVPAIGITISKFLEKLIHDLNIQIPIPQLPAIKLNGLTIDLSFSDDNFNFNIHSGGKLTLGPLGVKLRFDFHFTKTNNDNISLTLQIGDISFSLTKQGEILLFSHENAMDISLLSLIYLLELYPLYGLTKDISVSLKRSALAFDMQSDNKLIDLGIASDKLVLQNSPLLNMLTNAKSIGLSSLRILGTNSSLSGEPGTNKTPPGLDMGEVIPTGVSFLSDVVLGNNIFPIPLTPSQQESSNANAVTNNSSSQWYTAQRQVGPIQINQVSPHITNGDFGVAVGLSIDSALAFGAFSFGLNGFSLTVPVEKPQAFSAGLDGISVGYFNAPVIISGGLTDKGNHTYIGALILESEVIALSLLGEFSEKTTAEKQTYTSFSLFTAIVSPPLGGSANCFITGLALGGGYNSSLNMPQKAAEAKNFALVQAALGNNLQSSPTTIIEQCVQPKVGEDWLAIGLIFRSYEIIQSTLLLAGNFGQKLQFEVLGQSQISLPPNSVERLAFAQADILAHYSPSKNEVEVTGILTNNSFIFSNVCHVQGGFLYILKNSGNFILSFGGYGPHLHYQSLGYPSVPQLKFFWNIDPLTQIKGTAYCAITPAVMLAGGMMRATWHCGIFSAWFHVGVDLFMNWRPFYYEATFQMALGVSFDWKVLFVHIHFSFQIGAQLHIQGPPFNGNARINLSIVSFDIHFGPSVNRPLPLSWKDFRAILPGKQAEDLSQSSLLSVRVTRGLIKDLSQENSNADSPFWVVNGTDFSFDIESVIPFTQNAKSSSISLLPKNGTIGIRPMNISNTQSTISISIHDEDQQLHKAYSDPTSNIVVALINKEVASAHWGKPNKESPNELPLSFTSGYKIYGGKPAPEHTLSIPESVLLSTSENITTISNRSAYNNPFSN